MSGYTGLKAWQHARRLAVECTRACKALPRQERDVLGARLRRLAYAAVSAIAAGGISTGPARLKCLDRARRHVAQVEALLRVSHDLGYFSNRDFARLEAWCIETGRTLQGLRRKVGGANPRVSRPSPS